jgi:hypothetical protein
MSDPTATTGRACPGCTAPVPGHARACVRCGIVLPGHPLPPPFVAYDTVEVPPGPFALPQPPHQHQHQPAGIARSPGTAILLPAGEPPTGPFAHRRPRRGRLLAVAAGLAGAVVAAAVIALPNADAGPPQQPVQALFAALTAHNGDALNHLVTCAPDPLCTGRGLATGYQPPRDLRIRAVLDGHATPTLQASDHAVVQVRYQVAGTDHDTDIGLTRVAHGLFGHRWRITRPPGGSITLRSPALSQVHLAGADLTLTTPNDTTAPDQTATANRIWAPPGVYTATAVPDPLLTTAPVTITVTGTTDPAETTLPATVQPALTADIDRQVHARIDQCAAQHTMHPNLDPANPAAQRCPITHDSPYTITTQPTWRVDTYPHLTLHPAADGTLQVQTTTAGQASITYSWTTDILEPRRWTPTTATEPITIAGQVTLDHTTPTWTD